ncbi:MAG: type II toxin-antitoxin system RelE/ParE family toxin [Spirochaetes bacterium]|nr:type II toxin-antitoxin system RelE/ParE family toxin [Spirochaetota bacterium]
MEDIKNYIKKDSEYYAYEFTKKIFEYAEHLLISPKMGRIVPEINNKKTRELIYHNYRIIYRLKKDEIQILSVIHDARDLKKKKNRKWEFPQ